MPSEKTLLEKQEVVANLKSKLESSAAGVIVDYKGITVANDTKLRRELREAGVEYSVVKNTLLRRAASDMGYGELSSVLEGTTAMAVSKDDAFAPARILAKYAAESKGKFVIKAGFVEGSLLDVAGVEAISKIPSKQALLATVLGGLNAPISALAILLNAIAEKKGAEAVAE